MPRHVAASLIALCVVAPGCTLALTYPDADREVCDGTMVDDDLDGLVDCRDPDCDGDCPEADAVACVDGRDNDGDGRRDQEDFRCWPFMRTSARRCESIGPNSFVGSFEGLEGGWISDGTATVVPDPRDPTQHVGELPGSTDSVVTLDGAAIAGGLDGATLSFEIEIDDDSFAGVGFFVEGADRRPLIPDGIMATIYQRTFSVAGSSVSVSLFRAPPAGRRWVSGRFTFHHEAGSAPTFELDVDGRTFTHADLVATLGTWFPGAQRGDLPVAIIDGRSIRPLAAAASDILVGAYRLDLTRLDPCRAAPTPSRPSPPPVPVPQMSDRIVGIASNGDRVCTLSWHPDAATGGGQLLASVSTDGGSTFGPTASISRDDRLSVGTAPMQPDGDGFSAVVAWYAPPATLTEIPTIARLDVVETTACGDDWNVATADTRTFGGSLYAGGLDYEIGPTGRDLELVYFYTSTSASARLCGAHASNDEPTRFVFSCDAMVPFPSQLVPVDGFAGLDLHHVGEDRVVLYQSTTGIGAMVQQPDGTWVDLPEPLLAPSGVDGTFDQFLVSSGRLALAGPAPRGEPPRFEAALSFSAGDCAFRSACTPPGAVTRIELQPR